MRRLFCLIAVLLAPLPAGAVEYCMEVDPVRITLIGEATALYNERNDANLTQDAFISWAMREAVVSEIARARGREAIAKAEAEHLNFRDALAAESSQIQDEIDSRLGDW